MALSPEECGTTFDVSECFKPIVILFVNKAGAKFLNDLKVEVGGLLDESVVLAPIDDMLLLYHLVVDLVPMFEVIEHHAWWDMHWSVGGDLGLLPHEDQLRML